MPERISFDPQALLARYLDPQLLDNYYQVLMEQNQIVNLVSRETGRCDFDRLVAESILPLEFLPRKVNGYLDIGSGGGFPSVPILLSGSIDGRTVLVERTGKKSRALEQIVIRLDLSASHMASNFEEVRDLPKAELVTLRYVKLAKSLLARIMSCLAPGGRFVYYSKPDFDIGETVGTVYEFESPQDSVVKSFTIFSR